MHWTNLVHWRLATPTTELIWLSIGFAAQLLFSARFLVQWIATEKARASVIPETFWYFSFFGGDLVARLRCIHADPVFILGQATGLLIYARNIHFIWLEKREFNSLRSA